MRTKGIGLLQRPSRTHVEASIYKEHVFRKLQWLHALQPHAVTSVPDCMPEVLWRRSFLFLRSSCRELEA